MIQELRCRWSYDYSGCVRISGDNAANNLNAGRLLCFTMPQIFDAMGFGNAIGAVFFLLVLFAALTSAIALAESAVSTFEDQLHWSREKQL